MTAADPTFAAEGFSKRFGDSAVLKSATLRGRPGRVTALVGRNGSGKSMLIRCALGLLRADSGSVIWRGEATTAPRLDLMARGGLCFVPDRRLAAPGLTVAQHAARLRTVFSEASSLADYDPLDVSDFAPRRCATLSGGERRRVELTLGFLRNASCLIADEPLVGLAPKVQLDAVRSLGRAADRGAAVIVTGHEVELLLEVADEVVWLVAGGTRILGGPDQAWSHPGFRDQYVGRRSRIDGVRHGLPKTPRAGAASSTEPRARRERSWRGHVRRAWGAWRPALIPAICIWLAIRALLFAGGAAVGEPGVGATASGAGLPRSSDLAGPILVATVAACVLLAWVNHLRRGEGPLLANLGVGMRALVVLWTLTCITLEVMVRTLR